MTELDITALQTPKEVINEYRQNPLIAKMLINYSSLPHHQVECESIKPLDIPVCKHQ